MTLREFNALSERYQEIEEGLNYRVALICAMMANLWSDTKKRGKPYSPSDFMPGPIGTPKPITQTPEQMFATVEMLNAAFGGRVIEE